MPNEWIEKLKRFNADGGVWAIPKRNTDERKMLDRGQRFKYSLLKERFPDLSRQLEEEVTNREAKAKMRKAEELIKQAEAIEKVVKRKLRKAPEEEKPKEQAKPEEEEKPKKRKIRKEPVEKPKEEEVGEQIAIEYFKHVNQDEIYMPEKILKKYIEEKKMEKSWAKKLIKDTKEDKKEEADRYFGVGESAGQMKKWEEMIEKRYEEWLSKRKSK